VPALPLPRARHRRMEPGMATDAVRRTSRRARVLHTGVYLTTTALLVTGWWLLAGGEGHPSPLARLFGRPDTRVHVWFGWALTTTLAVGVVIGFRGVITFVRETFRVDHGDGRWFLRWPAGALTGRFARHEGHFDPGQRVANVILVGGLLVLTGTGIAMTTLHGGPVFARLAQIHRWTTIVLTPVIVGHTLIAVGVLPGYRGVWRAMHAGGRVPLATARRVWPAWTERSIKSNEGSASRRSARRCAQPSSRTSSRRRQPL
jgi:cytochrome b subunit of formate dehydrogenase